MLLAEIFLVGDGLGTGALVFLHGAALLYAVEGAGAVGGELPQAVEDNHGVDVAVEPAVTAAFELEEVEHELGHFQVVVVGGDEGGALVELALGEFAAAAAEFGEVDELRHEPHDGGLGAVGQADFGEGGHAGLEAPFGLHTEAGLQVGVETLQEMRQVAPFSLDKGGFALQVGT